MKEAVCLVCGGGYIRLAMATGEVAYIIVCLLTGGIGRKGYEMTTAYILTKIAEEVEKRACRCK